MVVKRDRKYGVINIKNEVIAPFEYGIINRYLINSIGLSKDGELFYVNEEGDILPISTKQSDGYLH